MLIGKNGEVNPRRIAANFKRITFSRVFEKSSVERAVIEERISLGRCGKRDYPLTLAFAIENKRKKRAPLSFHVVCEL